MRTHINFSLKQRALYTLLPFFLLFFILFAYLLYSSYQRSLTSAMEAQMLLQVRLLLADSELSSQGGVAITQIREPKLTAPDSDLRALILDSKQSVTWQSPSSLLTVNADFEAIMGEKKLRSLSTGDAGFLRLPDGMFVMAFAIVFEIEAGVIDSVTQPQLSDVFTYILIDSGTAFDEQLAVFRNTLLIGLVLAFVVFVALQLLILRWLFTPLNDLRTELLQVEQGEKASFSASYPSEITPLTQQLNNFIDSEVKLRERYRNTLSDLAHSLKTPIAALRVALSLDDKQPASEHQPIFEQVQRMEQIVSHQLKRATHSTNSGFGRWVNASDVAQRVIQALQKVYREKQVSLEVNIPADFKLPLAEDDCFELIGNVLDNAFKYCDTQIRLNAELDGPGTTAMIRIENDGKAISIEQREVIQQRGIRLDETAEGQGIGLSVTLSILQSYGGVMTFVDSALGGTALTLHIPLKL